MEGADLQNFAFQVLSYHLTPELAFLLDLAGFHGRSDWDQRQWDSEKNAKMAKTLLDELARLDLNPRKRRTQAMCDAMAVLYQRIDWALAQLARSWASAQQAGGEGEAKRMLRSLSHDLADSSFFVAIPV